MRSRMDKYYNADSDLDSALELPSRTSKNQELYKEVSNKELETFDENSNAKVLNNNVNNSVNIDQIREMLDRQYREAPKDKSIGDSETEIGKISLDETREYDINSILDASRKEREKNYEKDRLKKLRNTQVDILKELDSVLKEESVDDDILPGSDELDEMKAHRAKEEQKLKDLIDTITAKELVNEETVAELDPLDLLSDLRGDDDATKVLGTLEDTKEYVLNTNKEDEDDEDDEDEAPEEVEEKEDKEEKETKIMGDTNEQELGSTKTTTSTLTFTQSDFDDFNDLKEDMRFTKVLIKVLIGIIVLVFIAGCIVMANKIFNLGFF